MKYIIRRLKKLRQDRSAFTLIEMLLVLLIVAILMAIIIPNVSGQRKRINAQAAENIREIVTTQTNTYQLVEEDSNVTLEILVSEGYLTEKQKNEAEKFLVIQSLNSGDIQIKPEYQKP